MSDAAADALRTIALLGNYTPRQCGIATFTADLSDALHGLTPARPRLVVAMNDAGKDYVYPEHVRLQIAEANLAAYRRAAGFLNVSDVGVVSLQHEYGIFGGSAGSHVLRLLRELRMPIVTTLHTILAEPDPSQRAAMDEICSLSERLVVMSSNGEELLRQVHGVSRDKIDLIPHGIPILPSAADSKTLLGVDGKRVLLTFGLLSPDKGIEHVIDALPAIVERHPDVVYIVLGATHPHVKERHGEAYRLMLEARGHRLGVENHLVFHDRFVSNAELVQFLSAADIYITPYLNREQITSGTLAYAVGSGKAVISSPYRYAEELLAEGRGVLVPPKDSRAIGAAVIELFEDEPRRREMERRAASFGHSMTWPVVARAYLDSFERAVREWAGRARPSVVSPERVKRPAALPEVNLAHLRMMTDDTGMLQHATWSVPRYEDGYCVDDNARALLLLALVEDGRVEPTASLRQLTTRYLAFVRHAFNADAGRFRNFLSYSRRWTEQCGSEDSHGRTLWALGTFIDRATDPGQRQLAVELFRAALPATTTFTSPRAWAYTLLGIGECRSRQADDEVLQSTGRALAQRLLELFGRCRKPDWVWFEDRLTYCNARLSQALMVSGVWMENEEMLMAGLHSLEWLASKQTSDRGNFSPIGSNGFFEHRGPRAEYDQQPVEACGMVSACLLADRLTGDRIWAQRGRAAFDWFLGRNDLDQWLYDAGTGGCRDGLHPERVNENQGAESTLSFLMALIEVRQMDRPLPASPKLGPALAHQQPIQDSL